MHGNISSPRKWDHVCGDPKARKTSRSKENNQLRSELSKPADLLICDVKAPKPRQQLFQEPSGSPAVKAETKSMVEFKPPRVIKTVTIDPTPETREYVPKQSKQNSSGTLAPPQCRNIGMRDCEILQIRF